MFKAAFVLILLWMLASCANAPQISPAVRADLAPTGTLRVGSILAMKCRSRPLRPAASRAASRSISGLTTQFANMIEG